MCWRLQPHVLKARDPAQYQVCITWLKSTYLWARMKRNPIFYQLPRGLSEAELEERLKALCLAQLRALADAQMVRFGDDGLSIAPLPLGTLMARTCVRFETVKSFARLGVGCGLAEVVALLADSEELRDAATLRRTEVKALFEVNCSSDIRFPLLNDKAKAKSKSNCAKIKTHAQKASLLLQLRAAGVPLGEFSACENMLLLGARRVLRALVDSSSVRATRARCARRGCCASVSSAAPAGTTTRRRGSTGRLRFRLAR